MVAKIVRAELIFNQVGKKSKSNESKPKSNSLRAIAWVNETRTPHSKGERANDSTDYISHTRNLSG
ncbi:MAG: hypothetical protein A3C06_02590 [Candidatus Taylorbacteria bacterium RIFCSPHIGHO2_02_FULL_46_13]|uniref:Uncharacterized protein n=1 Tax=Candidatus Taylorbacteria bacterium RIFCSPHIGHO2_02_FULL_46_13 TaxID=1802312 RepID=A0A1G2MRF7_9BACT|nr:MAG: hypothetical protein A3C06_02590 [Candidatus Taylorbacteria bacterium RIFCSPHIGHO2_02_FULL_46_13]